MNTPQVVKDHGFGGKLEKYKWDNQKLWKLDLPVEEIEVEQLEWIIDSTWWTDGTSPYNLKPRQVIENPDRYPEHKKRLQECDTSIPIDIMLNKNGEWLILDGLHRLVKLVMEGETKVKVRKVGKEYTDQILREK